MGLQVIIKAPILAVWAVSKIYTKNLTWSIYTGLFVLFLLLIVSVVIILILPKTLRIQRLTDDLNKITRENITGIRVIKAFNAEDYQKNKFEDTNELVTNTNLFIAIATALFFPIIMFLMSALTLLIYYTGAKMIDTALMPEKIETFSNMIVFSAYATQVIMAFMMLVMIFIIYPRARVSANRVMEVLKEKITLKEGSFKGKTKLKSTVEFKNVSFKYPDANECLLSDINFKVEEGETIAIIGSTASGKSTLINLIPRLYDVTKGEVLVNGINVKNYKRKTLNKLISYVSQKPVIFKGTIKSNVAFGTPGLTSKKINSALKIAQAKQFVNKLKDKEKSFVSARGTNLSGGQKQRLSIARAIARNPEIFIFDDSFSALDYKTDLALRESLFKSNKGATKFIVAQRIGTIINADKIIVLDEGKIVGLGTHQELLKTNKIYKEIALAQLKEEELS